MSLRPKGTLKKMLVRFFQGSQSTSQKHFTNSATQHLSSNMAMIHEDHFTAKYSGWLQQHYTFRVSASPVFWHNQTNDNFIV